MALGLVGGCKPPQAGNQTAEAANVATPMSGEEHLHCAGLISAAEKLMTSGDVPHDPGLNSSFTALMAHTNAYAIPKGMKEPDAAGDVANERTRILGANSRASIVADAKRCVEQAPSS